MRVHPRRVRVEGQGPYPAVLYLCFAVAFLYLFKHWFDYPVFLRIGPLVVEPDQTLSRYAWVFCVLLSVPCGLAYVRGSGRDAGLAEALFGAALCSASATGLYLLCYTLWNGAFRAAFLTALLAVLIVTFMRRRAAKSCGAVWKIPDTVRPFLFLMACAGFVTCTFSGWALTAYSYEQPLPEDPEDRRLAANIDSAASFFDGSFEDMSLRERADKAGDIIMVEANYLGVEGPVRVSVEACARSGSAHYDAEDNRIVFSTAYLMTQPGPHCVKSAAHETAHVFQRQASSGQLPADTKTSWPGGFPDEERRRTWINEMSGYVSPSRDLVGYFKQDIERSARRYSYDAVADIKQRVEKYRETGNPEP